MISVRDAQAHILDRITSPASPELLPLAAALGRVLADDGDRQVDVASFVTEMQRRLDDGEIREVIVATNFTNEGEATAHYIYEMLRGRGLRISRIARGIPVGGELEYVDAGTLAQAFTERRPL